MRHDVFRATDHDPRHLAGAHFRLQRERRSMRMAPRASARVKPVTYVIRERRARDLETCVALLAQVHVTQRYPIRWPDDPRAWLTPPDAAGAWVATLHDDVIGHVCVVSKDLAPSELTLERLFVSPDAAGSGVGRALMNHASNWAAVRRSRLTLDVAENCAKAIALYGRLGWRLTGQTPIDWGDDAADSLLHFEAPTGEVRRAHHRPTDGS